MTREEMVAASVAVELAVIEKGWDAKRVLPDAIRLVELRARVPRYQKEMLRYLARHEGTSIGAVLSRELEDMASARAEELAAAVPSVALALQL